jgi:hypothetical protein
MQNRHAKHFRDDISTVDSKVMQWVKCIEQGKQVNVMTYFISGHDTKTDMKLGNIPVFTAAGVWSSPPPSSAEVINQWSTLHPSLFTAGKELWHPPHGLKIFQHFQLSYFIHLHVSLEVQILKNINPSYPNMDSNSCA